MDNNVKRAKKLLESKGYKVSDGLEDIREAFEATIALPEPEDTDIINYADYEWNYSTLEEALMDYVDEKLYETKLLGDQAIEFDLGDIVMTNAFYSYNSKSVVKNRPHRILVITSKKDEDGIIRYRGFELSSNISKSNKNGGFKNSLHIDNYGSILDRSRPGAVADKPAIILVNDLVKFNSKDLSKSGSYKGHVSREFLEFVQQAYNNYKTGRSNSQMYWENSEGGN